MFNWKLQNNARDLLFFLFNLVELRFLKVFQTENNKSLLLTRERSVFFFGRPTYNSMRDVLINLW